MQRSFLSLALLSALNLLQAETTVTLEGVHNCCKSCANGITGAAKGMKDVTVTAEGDKVTINAKNDKLARKAVDAIMEAGYYGSNSLVASSSAASADKKLTEATVTGAHLCCGKCSKAMAAAIESVKGVKEHSVATKVKSFTVKGEFTAGELLAAMNKAGFHGSVK